MVDLSLSKLLRCEKGFDKTFRPSTSPIMVWTDGTMMPTYVTGSCQDLYPILFINMVYLTYPVSTRSLIGVGVGASTSAGSHVRNWSSFIKRYFCLPNIQVFFWPWKQTEKGKQSIQIQNKNYVWAVVFAEPRYMASGAELNGENHILFEQQNTGK